MEKLSEKVPLLFRGAISRTGDDSLPGAYCPKRHVWIVDDEPIVLGQALPEMLTKTDAIRESDDKRTYGVVEMLTKTKAQLESDDDRIDLRATLEMLTKTESQTESDD